MGAHAQAFLDVLPTLAAPLRREARGHSDDLMTGSFSLVFQDTEKRAPTGVVNTLGEMVAAHHPTDVQVFHTDMTVSLGIVLGGLEMEVAALATDLEMLVCYFSAGLAAAMTSVLATAHGALSVCQAFLPSTIVAWVLDRAAFGVGQKHLQAHIQSDSQMVACCLRRMDLTKGVLGRCLADDQGIPVPVRAQDEMGRHWRAFQGAMQLDLEQAAQLSGQVQMLPVLVQPDITAHRVLAELNRVPAVRRLEAGEAHRKAEVLHLKIPF